MIDIKATLNFSVFDTKVDFECLHDYASRVVCKRTLKTCLKVVLSFNTMQHLVT